MTFHARRALVGASIALVAPMAVVVMHLLAGPAHEPASSAFASGGPNLGNWTQDVSSGYEVRSVVSGLFLASDVRDHASTLVVISGPQRVPTAAEDAALRRHLEHGGSLWILDDAGTMNPWLSSHGVAIGPHRLVASQVNLGPGLVNLEGGDAGTRFPAVVARAPASLVFQEARDWETWLQSGPDSHLDITRNGTVDRIDPPGPHVVGAALRVQGGGFLVAASDTTLLSDDLWGVPRSDNSGFARWLVKQVLPEGGMILVDESQQGWTGSERLPVAATMLGQGVREFNVVATAALLGLCLVATWVLIRNTPRLTAYARHHPSDPVAAPPAQNLDKSVVHEIAWEVLARQSRQPLQQLKSVGAAEAAHGLSDDPALRRVLVGEGTPQETLEVLRRFTGEDKRSIPTGVKK